jgi:hypoxanthine phosphoribosyltransferase
MIIVTWDRYDEHVKCLSKKLENRDFDRIVGIARGGLPLMTSLSHILGIRNNGIIQIQRTLEDGGLDKLEEPVFEGALNIGMFEKVLLVDDIVGEGKTLELAIKILEEDGNAVESAVLSINKMYVQKVMPDHHCFESFEYVKFPWN